MQPTEPAGPVHVPVDGDKHFKEPAEVATETTQQQKLDANDDKSKVDESLEKLGSTQLDAHKTAIEII